MKINEIQQQLKVPKNHRNTFGNYNYRNAEDPRSCEAAVGRQRSHTLRRNRERRQPQLRQGYISLDLKDGRDGIYASQNTWKRDVVPEPQVDTRDIIRDIYVTCPSGRITEKEEVSPRRASGADRQHRAAQIRGRQGV
jgi:hypothetical protein